MKNRKSRKVKKFSKRKKESETDDPIFRIALVSTMKEKKNNDISLDRNIAIKVKIARWKRKKQRELVGRPRSIEDEIVMDSCGIGASPGG